MKVNCMAGAVYIYKVTHTHVYVKNSCRVRTGELNYQESGPDTLM